MQLGLGCYRSTLQPWWGQQAGACARNASAIRFDDILMVLVNNQNQTPAQVGVTFPATVQALQLFTNAECDALLQFYNVVNPHPGNLQGANLARKRRLLARHLGVPNC